MSVFRYNIYVDSQTTDGHNGAKTRHMALIVGLGKPNIKALTTRYEIGAALIALESFKATTLTR
jgi:hypothetical protein